MSILDAIRNKLIIISAMYTKRAGTFLANCKIAICRCIPVHRNLLPPDLMK